MEEHSIVLPFCTLWHILVYNPWLLSRSFNTFDICRSLEQKIMCACGNSSPDFISNIWNVACARLQLESAQSRRSRFYFGLFNQPPTHIRGRSLCSARLGFSLGEVVRWKILICAEPTVYPQTDFKRGGGWKIERPDLCSLRGIRQNWGSNHSNGRDASEYKEWGMFVFFLDGLLFVDHPIHSRLSLSPDCWAFPTNWSLHWPPGRHLLYR